MCIRDRDYQTLAEAEQAAQKYVAGTMEGEDGFAYDGAGIYLSLIHI